MSKDKNNNEEGSDRTYLNFLDSSPNSELVFGELFTKFTNRCITNEAMKRLNVFGRSFMIKTNEDKCVHLFCNGKLVTTQCVSVVYFCDGILKKMIMFHHYHRVIFIPKLSASSVTQLNC